MRNWLRVLTGGVPTGRWREGLLFEGIEPQPWLKSAANWFPGTEERWPTDKPLFVPEEKMPASMKSGR